MHRKFPFLFGAMVSVLMIAIISGCSNTYVKDIKRGAGYKYIPGFPELRIESYGFIDDDNNTHIKVTGNVVESSLIFKRQGNALAAGMLISIFVENEETNESKQVDFTETISRTNETSPYEGGIFIFQKQVPVSPGNYRVQVTVMDLSSQKEIMREAEAFIPNPTKGASNITNIRVLAKKTDEGTGFLPVTTYDIGLDTDSVRFEFQVTNNRKEEPITLQSRLIKFRSDTSIARPMSYSDYTATSLPFKGVDYDRFEIIQSSRRVLNQSGSVVIQFDYTNLKRGNYRFEVSEEPDNEDGLYKARDFSIKSNNYPYVKSALELARPLIYIMSDGEYEDLMAIKDPDSIKTAVDRFWLENIPNSAKAKSVIQLYYERVVEANKFFANFKEGWKTDPGMIYILFGPPLDIYERLRTVRWSYKIDQEDPDYTYYFNKSKTNTDYYPFDNLILQRNNSYFNIEYRQRQLWLSGNILQTQH